MVENELLVRLAVFIGLFAALAALESLWPRRPRQHVRARRWATNWAIVILDSLALRAMAVFMPLLAVGAAVDAGNLGIGALNAVGWPEWLEVLIAVLALDFVIWGQHLVTHKVPLLWRLHRVHHADVDVDVTTAIRFHPIEIALSMVLKIGVVYALGPSALAVILFEIVLNGTAMFNHANLKLPLWLDRIVRLVFVTPDMHRVHHSVYRAEHDANYGFALSVWDRVFNTYVEQPQEGHDGMKTGLEWRDDSPTKLGWSLLLPFK